jgi:hypothetical protein
VVAVAVMVALVAVVALVVGLSSGGGGRSSTVATSASASTSSLTSTTTTASTTPAALAPAQPAPSGEELGASVNLLFNSLSYSPAQIATQLQALAATGVTTARSDALWQASEPAAPVGGVHTYAWGFDDTVAGDLAAHRLRWLPILDYSAPWAESVPGQSHSPPASAADFAAYAGAFAARYGSGGSFWRSHPDLPVEPVLTYEIWNEPDQGEFWSPTPDAARYADLYVAAREAIDAADPAARVIIGGLTHPTDFLPAILAARPQLRGHIDGVAIHPYGVPLVVLSRIRQARATLNTQGMSSVPLYVTEFGWTTSPPGALDYVPAGLRPGYIEQTVTALGHLNCGLAAAVLYTWFSPQQNSADSQEWYGINGVSGDATPDTVAFTRGLRAATARGATVSLCRR